jgi:hypothetical protein
MNSARWPGRLRSSTRRAVLGLGILAVLAMAACGQGKPTAPQVAAQIGDVAITTTAVAHWMRVLAPEHYVPDALGFRGCVERRKAIEPEAVAAPFRQECQSAYKALAHRATALLIVWRWAIDEARERGLSASEPELRRRLRSGPAPAALIGGGGSSGDERLALEAESAAVRIRDSLAAGEAPVTRRDIAAYYRSHIARYAQPEQRDIYIAEHIPTAEAAARLRGKIASGTLRIEAVALREAVSDRHPKGGVPGKLALATAIFTARPHVLSGLLLFDRQYAFFEVTRVTRASVQPLSRVERTIRASLARERRRRTLARFATAWQQKWVARTTCRAEYVVTQCSEYSGPRARLAFPPQF